MIFCQNHFQSFVSCRTNFYTGTTSSTVISGNGDRKALGVIALKRYACCTSFFRLLLCNSERTDNSVRTNVGAPVALHTLVWIPLRNIYCDTALFICSSTRWNRSIRIIYEDRNRNGVAFHSISWFQNLIDVIRLYFIASFRSRNCKFTRCISP